MPVLGSAAGGYRSIERKGLGLEQVTNAQKVSQGLILDREGAEQGPRVHLIDRAERLVIIGDELQECLVALDIDGVKAADRLDARDSLKARPQRRVVG